MAKCDACHRDVVQVTYGGTTYYLDPVPLTYITANEHHIYPDEGDKVVLSTALVEHSVVCQARWREEERQRERHRQRRQTA